MGLVLKGNSLGCNVWLILVMLTYLFLTALLQLIIDDEIVK